MTVIAGIAIFALSAKTASAGGLQNPQNNLGLVGYWPMEDATGTIATDASGRGNAGVLTLGPTWQGGKLGKALSFDGTDDKVVFSSALNSSIYGTNARTVSFWFKAGIFSSDFSNIIFSQSNTGGTGAYLLLYASGEAGNGIAVGYNGHRVGYGMGTLSTNTWYHFSLVIPNAATTDQTRGYINGALVATSTIAGSSVTINTTTEAQTLGVDRVGVGYYRGALDDFRIYNRALSATEVASLYGTRQVTRSAANNTGLIGHWNFEDATGTLATDASGKGNTGTLTNGPVWVNGKFGKAVLLDGSDDIVTLTNDSLNLVGSMSISTWVYHKNNAKIEHIVTKNESGTNTPWQIALLTTGAIRSYNFGSGLSDLLDSTQTIPLNSWQHIVFVRDSGTSKLTFYINGAQDSGGWQTYNPSRVATNNINASIGSRPDGANWFTGLIDDVRIYNRALSSAEVATLYGVKQQRVNAPNNTGLIGYWSFEDATGTQATDFSGKAHTGTLVNSPTWTNGKFGKALTFNGSSTTYVNIGSVTTIDDLGPLTASAWIKPTSMGGGNRGTIISKTEGIVGGSWRLRLDGIQGINALVFLKDCSGNDLTLRTTDNAITLNSWQHVAISWAGGMAASTAKIYVNGLETGYATTVDCTGALASDASNELWIGGTTTFSRVFGGDIDDVRLYNRALSAVEISDLYNTGR